MRSACAPAGHQRLIDRDAQGSQVRSIQQFRRIAVVNHHCDALDFGVIISERVSMVWQAAATLALPTTPSSTDMMYTHLAWSYVRASDVCYFMQVEPNPGRARQMHHSLRIRAHMHGIAGGPMQ